MPTTTSLAGHPRAVGSLVVTPYLHPQGCRGYLVVDPESREALLLDPHLDLVAEAVHASAHAGLRVRFIVDTHTHADHPSGSAALAKELGAERVAHAKAEHMGVTRTPDDREPLLIGGQRIVVRHTPGHTPDHMVLVSEGALFSGDSLFIGGVARTDFIGGDAGQLFDSLHDVMLTLPDETVLFPGHDYQDRIDSTIGSERTDNPWLKIQDRDEFVRHLTANAPPEPANMSALLRFNRQNEPIPPMTSVEQTMEIVRGGGAGTIIDVRNDDEIEALHIPGSRHIVLNEIPQRVDEVRKTPAPRLILCRTGPRAMQAAQYLASVGVSGLSVVEGGITEYVRAGGTTKGGGLEALDGGGGCCAAPPPGG